MTIMGMGTTMTLLWEGERRILIGHVGDSRAYRLRDGKLSQITQDHSVVGELLRNQVITPEMAKKHPYRNIITRAVGIDPVVEVDVLSEDKQLDDLWLVCSDGLYNMVDDKDIEEILNTLNEEKAADRLLELALEGCQPDILDSYHVTYRCDCSEERVENMIRSLGKKEVEKLRDEDPIAEVNCQFCNKNYKVDLNELLKKWPASDEKQELEKT